jgi:hypothetical protein
VPEEEEIWFRVEWGEEPSYAVVVQDDGARVAYAYLLRNGKIVADVWLYNRGPLQDAPEWKLPEARSLLPFKNPAGFARAEAFTPVCSEQELTVTWSRDEEGRVGADISIRGQPHARLREGSTPGWCVLAARDGPIARAL